MPYSRRAKAFFFLLRNLLLAGLLYACILGIANLIRTRTTRTTHEITNEQLFQETPAILDSNDTDPKLIESSRKGFKVKFPGMLHPMSINPYANFYNRPESLVQVKDDYMGPRPHVDSEIYFPKIIDACRGNEWGAERMPFVANCLHYLAFSQGDYTLVPAKRKRASSQDPRIAEYLNADNQNNTADAYPDPEHARRPSKHSRGTCAGPIIPFHTYWHGAATWRLELFIKAYLYTQNIACSRLHIWLDEDESPNLVERTLTENPIFRRFLPLVDRGDIVVESWKFPNRVAMPSADREKPLRQVKIDGEKIKVAPRPKKGTTKDKNLGKDAEKEAPEAEDRDHSEVADEEVEEVEEAEEEEVEIAETPDQIWLQFTGKQLSMLPSPPTEAMRWVTLHRYGGVFFDPDVIMLRDMRPLLLPGNHSFAQRWRLLTPAGEYGTSVVSLTANSSLSSYFLQGGVRMSMNFHPLVLGTMARKDNRNHELVMLENTIFDPLWVGNGKRIQGRCPTPCLDGNEGKVFQGRNNSIYDEWRGFDGDYSRRPRTMRKMMGQQVVLGNLRKRRLITVNDDAEEHSAEQQDEQQEEQQHEQREGQQDEQEDQQETESASQRLSPLQLDADTFTSSFNEYRALKDLGVIFPYDSMEDVYPPSNRTLEHFFRGAYTYTIHKQWNRHPEPNSWLDVMRHAHNGFFRRQRTNPYGEKWTGPDIEDYGRWIDFV